MTLQATTERPAILRLLRHDMRYAGKVFLRSPLAAMVTIVFPLVFMVMFTMLRGDTVVGPDEVPFVQYTVPGVIVFVVTGSCYLTMATGIVSAREKGVLKRLRSTPIPPAVHLAARIAITTLVAAVGVVLMMAIAVGFFGLVLSPADMPGLVATFLLGSAVFCVLGVAVTPLMPTVESSQAIATATLYPMLFLSGVFFPIDGAPTFVRAIIAALPGRPFVLLLQRPFLADSAALGPMLPQVLVLLAWGIAGAVLALRTMRWEPGNSPG